MPLYLNGTKYVGAYRNGQRINGYLNRNKLFSYGTHIVFNGNSSANYIINPIDNSNVTVNLPFGYHTINGEILPTNIVNDGNTYTFDIAPNEVTDTITFNGNSLVNPETKYGYYNNSDSIAVPTNYHFINGSNGQFIHNGGSHSFDVAPNQIILHFSNGTYTAINTTGDTNSTYTVQGSDLPAHYSLTGSPMITFVDNGYDHIYNMNVAADTNVTDPIVFNGNTDADKTQEGTYKSAGSVAAPANYHFINGSNGSLTYDGNTHSFDVAPNQIRLQFSDGTIVPVNTSTVDGDVYLVKPTDVPAHHSLSHPVVISFNNNGYNEIYPVSSVGSTVTDTINFNGNSSSNGKTESGHYNSDGNVSAPANYHFINGSNGRFKFNGNTHTFDVAPNQIILHFSNGTYKAIDTSDDTNNTYTVQSGDVPNSYHLTNTPDNITFGDNAYDQVYNVNVSDPVTDTIIFAGDSDDNTTMTGNIGTTGTVDPPAFYHFTDSSLIKNIVYNGSTYTFHVDHD